jgi:spore coat protein U-like protein
MVTKFNQNNIKLGIVSAILIGSTGISTASFATETDGNMTVTTTIGTVCTVTAPTLTFLNYDGTVEVEATANISSSCTLGGAVVITLDDGLNPESGDAVANPNRQMKRAGVSDAGVSTDYLSYNLYTDAKITEWGTGENNDIDIVGTGSSENTVVTGTMASGQAVTAGTYSDTVKVTLTF